MTLFTCLTSIEINKIEDKTDLYQHCDNRIKKKNEIPSNGLSELQRIK